MNPFGVACKLCGVDFPGYQTTFPRDLWMAKWREVSDIHDIAIHASCSKLLQQVLRNVDVDVDVESLLKVAETSSKIKADFNILRDDYNKYVDIRRAISSDPFRASAVTSMIWRSEKKQIRKHLKIGRAKSNLLADSTSAATAPADYLVNTLPWELRYQVLDCLGLKEFKNLIAAVGWKLPDSYFRQRIRKDIFFEINHPKTPSKHSWKELCFNSEAMLERVERHMECQKLLRNGKARRKMRKSWPKWKEYVLGLKLRSGKPSGSLWNRVRLIRLVQDLLDEYKEAKGEEG
ncbi:hypothetical protein AJ80_05933 [Polytolypa hystricis UAMH7299]|uniref:Uncharacterized protein n=1 Tax=Polytolypa hystricis (strain UAMH7299) TaxID=1447883 RepID=A0A2B7XZY8_POLH7|nr:hypothetical protein AJ80_05933 [Polytolypa hystricis UAMH7299]